MMLCILEVYFSRMVLLVRGFSQFSQIEAAKSLKSLHVGKYLFKEETPMCWFYVTNTQLILAAETENYFGIGS